MAKEYAKPFYHSKEWIKTRQAYKQSKFGICERCSKPNAEIVHHKKYITESNIKDSDIALNFNNLELLCIECHNREHFEKYNPLVEGLCFDSSGQLIRKPV